MTGAAGAAVAYTIFKKLPTCMTFGNNVVGYQLSYFCGKTYMPGWHAKTFTTCMRIYPIITLDIELMQ